MNQMPEQASQGSNFFTPFPSRIRELAGGLRVEAELDGI